MRKACLYINMILEKCKSSDAMRKYARDLYQGHCVITGLHRSELGHMGPVMGCHIFSASVYPSLRSVKLNGLPICDYRHSPLIRPTDSIGCMDYNNDDSRTSRRPDDRYRWLLTHCHTDYRGEVVERLWRLVEAISEESKDRQLLALVPDLIKIMETHA